MGSGDFNQKAELMSQLPAWVWATYAYVCLCLAPVLLTRLAKGTQRTIGRWGVIGAVLASNFLLFFLTTFLMASVIASYYCLNSSEIMKLLLLTTEKLLTSKTLIVGWIFQGAVVLAMTKFIVNRGTEGLRS